MLNAKPCGCNGNGWEEAVEKRWIVRDKKDCKNKSREGEPLRLFVTTETQPPRAGLKSLGSFSVDRHVDLNHYIRVQSNGDRGFTHGFDWTIGHANL